MIEINLLPQELRKEKKRINIKIPELPRTNLFKAAVGILCALILIHMFLAGIFVIKKIRLSILTRRWEKIGPTKEQIDTLKKDMNFMENKLRTVEQLTTKTKIIWSEKFNEISNLIPNGVWLRKIFVSGQNLEIEGSAVSKKGEEMILVGKFTNNLKKEDRFYSDFADIEVKSIQRRKIGLVEVVDFVIFASLKKDIS